MYCVVFVKVAASNTPACSADTQMRLPPGDKLLPEGETLLQLNNLYDEPEPNEEHKTVFPKSWYYFLVLACC